MQITFPGDSDIRTTAIAATLQAVLDQPSEWIITIEHADGTVSGIICDLNIEGSMVTVQDHDGVYQPTGAETTVDFHDITELVIH